jgi:hypothetical protein
VPGKLFVEMTKGAPIVDNSTETMTNWRPFVIDSVAGTIMQHGFIAISVDSR